MKIKLSVILVAVMAFTCTQAMAADVSPCLDVKFSDMPVLTIAKLPSQITQFLGGISDRGGPFGFTDMTSDPSQRFIMAVKNKECIFVAIETGGLYYNVQSWVFLSNGFGWEAGPQLDIPTVAESLEELLKWSQASLERMNRSFDLMSKINGKFPL
jgi:hypothetical protein